MKYEVFGDNLPAVTISLNRGESIYTQSGGMSWMTDGIRMETNMKGGLMKGLGRMLSGDSLFMATFTAETDNQAITIASSYPGNIITLDLSGGMQYVCQKSAFLCAQPTVELSVELVKGLKGGLFGGEGFVLQRVSGNGLVFLELSGSIKEINLKPGERLLVDTGNVAIYEASVGYSAELVKGFSNMLFGGEGLFLTTLTGPGKVYLQTIAMPAFAAKIAPFLPSKKD